MIKDISGLSSPLNNDLRTGRNSPQAKVNNEQAQNTPSSPQGNVAGRSDQIELSRQAQQLKGLEEKLSQQPDVDQERVANIKARIDSGDFAIDNLSLADKILSSEALFGK